MSVNIIPETSEKYEIYEIEVECDGARLIIRMLERNKWEDYLMLIDENLSQII